MNKQNEPTELDAHLNKPPTVRCAFIELVDPKTLVPHPLNPNQHPPKQLELFAAILSYSGCRRAVTVSNRSGHITKGHGQVLAYIQSGWTKIPVDFQEYESDEQELADVMADNQLARMSEMDNKQLQDNLVKLDTGAFNMELTGFDNIKLEKIFTGFGSKPNEPVFSGGEGAPVGGEQSSMPTGEQEAPGEAASHVRMVQLFLNEETQAEFMEICDYFQKLVQTDNVTDTVLEVLRSAYRSHNEGQQPDAHPETDPAPNGSPEV